MFNAILKKLNSHGTEMVSLESLEAALAQLSRDRASACAELSILQKDRKQELMDDATDAVLDKLDRKIERTEVALEKYDLAKKPLQDRVAAARGAAKETRWVAHKASFALASDKYLKSARVCLAALHETLACIEAAQAEFPLQVQHLPRPATLSVGLRGYSGVLAHDLLDRFAKDWVMLYQTMPSVRAPAPPPVAKRKPPANLQHAVALHPGERLPAAQLRSAKAANDTEPLAPGNVRAKVLRNGYSPADDQPQCYAGQIIQLPHMVALSAANVGVLEILAEPLGLGIAAVDVSGQEALGDQS